MSRRRRSKKQKTRDKYNKHDGTHQVCNKCGFCITCKDCYNVGCGAMKRMRESGYI